MTVPLTATCGYAACQHRADGRCDCSWTELQGWPDVELLALVRTSPAILRQAVNDAARADAATLDHGLTLLALEQLIAKDLGADDMKTEIRAIAATATNPQPQKENLNAAELR